MMITSRRMPRLLVVSAVGIGSMAFAVPVLAASTAPSRAPARQILSPDTEMASTVPGQPGQPTQVTITSGLGLQAAIGSYHPAGDQIPNLGPAPPTIAAGRVFWVDDTGTISSLAAHTTAPVTVGVIPGVLPTTWVSLAVSPSGAQVFAAAVTIPSSTLTAADERIFSISAGSAAVQLNRQADRNWASAGVPDLIGWDGEGPIEVTDANLLSAQPEHGRAVHLDAVTGNVADPIGSDSCILVSQTHGGASLCGTDGTLVFNVLSKSGKPFWKAPAQDGWIDQVAQLSPDAGSVATADHVYDYLGNNRPLPTGFTATGWVDSTHVLGVSGDTHDLGIVDVTSIERVDPIAVQGVPLGVVVPDDIITTDPPVLPTPTPQLPPVVAAVPPTAPNLTVVYVAGLLLLGGGGGFLYYRKNRERVDALVAMGKDKYHDHEEEAKTRRTDAMRVAPRPKPPAPAPRPTHSVAVRGPDFSALLDERARLLVMHDLQSYCNYVVRWLAQDPDGQEMIAQATPDLPATASREDRLERGAHRLAKTQTFTATSRTLIVPWLSSSSRTTVPRA